MIQLFRGASPFALFLIPVIIILCRLPELIGLTHFQLPDNLSLSWFRENAFNVKNLFPPITGILIDSLFVVFMSGIANYSLIKFGLFERNQLMINLLMVVMFSLFPIWDFFSEISLSIFFVLLSIRFVLEMLEDESGRESIFFSGLFFSLGIIFYFPFIGIIIPILYALFLRTYKPADWLLFTIGLFLPLYAIGIYYYYQSEVFRFTDQWVKLFDIQFHQPPTSVFMIIGIGFLTLIGLYSFAVVSRLSGEYRVLKMRRQFNFIFLLMPGIYISAIISGDNFYQCIKFLAFPIAVFHAKALLRERVPAFERYILTILFLGVLFFRFKNFIQIPTF